ncbi:MAG TPA: DUF1761 domain-containing protein [Burkholderiales bacterium]|nr:DUF1761 domain-containing protein [Burkholderiales bacterium]
MLVDPGSLNGWAILAAALVAYALGGVWYAPPAFGNAWLRALGKRPEELGSPVRAMAIQFLLTLVTAAVLALLVVRFGAITWAEGAAIGLVAGVGLVATSLASDYLFCGWSLRLYSIQVAYKLVSLTLMGAILSAWR